MIPYAQSWQDSQAQPRGLRDVSHPARHREPRPREDPRHARGAGPRPRDGTQPDQVDPAGGERHLRGMSRCDRAVATGATQHRDVQPQDAQPPKVAHCDDCHAQVVHSSIPGVTFVPPQSMTACFTCHDGKAQPDACSVLPHRAPQQPRGMPGLPQPEVLGARRLPPPGAADRTSRDDPVRAVPHELDGGKHGTRRRMRELPRRSPQQHAAARLLEVPHDDALHCRRRSSTNRSGRTCRRATNRSSAADCHAQTLAVATCSCHGGNPPTGG